MGRRLPGNLKRIINKHTFKAAAIGAPGAFAAHADIPFLVGVWAQMLNELTQASGRDMDAETVGRLAVGIGVAAGTVGTGVKAANTYFAWTGAGTVLAVLFNSGANALATDRIGKTSADLLLKDELSLFDICKGVFGFGSWASISLYDSKLEDALPDRFKPKPR